MWSHSVNEFRWVINVLYSHVVNSNLELIPSDIPSYLPIPCIWFHKHVKNRAQIMCKKFVLHGHTNNNKSPIYHNLGPFSSSSPTIVCVWNKKKKGVRQISRKAWKVTENINRVQNLCIPHLLLFSSFLFHSIRR